MANDPSDVTRVAPAARSGEPNMSQTLPERPAPIDLDAGAPLSVPNKLPPSFAVEKYDPVRSIDHARKYIAYALIAILAVVIVFVLSAVVWMLGHESPDRAKYDYLVGVVNIVFGPIVTLVGSATGFYFGSQNRSPQQGGTAANSPP